MFVIASITLETLVKATRGHESQCLTNDSDRYRRDYTVLERRDVMLFTSVVGF